MNLFTKKGQWLLTAIVCLILSTSTSYGQLSGSYTINPGISASSTNYKNFASAVSDLRSGMRTDGGTANGKGVTGPVVFRIADGKYHEKITIGAIAGASASNTITFQSNSGDSSKVVLWDSTSTSSTNNFTLLLDTAKYITIKQISILRVGTDANSMVMVLRGGSSNNRFIGNFLMTKLDPSNTSTGIAVGNPVINSISSSDTNNLYQGNRIRHGYNGIALPALATANVIKGNIFDTSGMSGVYAPSQTRLVVTENIFYEGAFSPSISHYVSYGVRFDGGTNFTVTKNKFYATSNATVSRCLVSFSAGTSGSTRNLIANNFLWVSAGTSSSTGITLGGNTNLDVVYNNVLMTSTPSASAAIYFYSGYTGSNNVIKNNNLVNKGTGYAYDNSNGSSAGISVSDNNNLFTKGSLLARYGITNYSTLSSWWATGLDSHSVSTDPGYVSNTNLHTSSAAINNKGIPFAAVTTDIDGETRSSSTPDIGADEFKTFDLDAGVSSLDSPTVYCAGTKNIVVRFTNFGNNTLTSATINWSVNGTLQTAYNWSGSLASAATTSQLTLGSLALAANTPYILKIWTSSPNGGTDSVSTNDTLRKTINSGLSGVYTIGGSSPDFARFNDALNAITLRSLCGPTVFKVRNGTYTEQISVPNYPASSQTNTITFQSESGDNTSVTLAYPAANSSGTNNVALQLNGARYVTFKNMTIMRTGTGTFKGVVEIKGGAFKDSFSNNRLIGVLGGNTTDADVITSTADQDTAIVINGNNIQYGFNGINFNGTSSGYEKGNQFFDNRIDSTYGNGINVSYNEGISIHNNKMLVAYSNSNTYSGIQLSNSGKNLRLNANEINMFSGGKAGIYLLNSSGTSGSEGLVSNNFVGIATGTGNSKPYGILDSSSAYQNFYNNSVNIYKTNVGAAFYINNASGNVNVKNNIFNNSDGGYSIIVANTSSLTSSDYNDLYTKGSIFGYWGTTSAANLSAWKTVSSMDAHSISVYPYFEGNSNYQTHYAPLAGAGEVLSAVTTDITGKSRPTSNHAIGAFEFTKLKNDAGITAITAPATVVCSGTKTVTVTLKNSGTDTLRTAHISWKVNGTAQTSYHFSGKLAPDSSVSINIGTYAFSPTSALIKVYPDSVNGVRDSFPFNDTASTTITVYSQPTANVGSTRTICSGTNTTIGATSVTGYTYSWTSNPAGFSSSAANPTVSPTVTTTYKLTVSVSGGCSATDSVKVTVKSSPTVTVGSPSTICAGTSVQIGSTAVGGVRYSWTSTPSGFTSTASNPLVSPSVTTVYKLTVTDTLSGCPKSDSVKITVNPLPSTGITASKSICLGQSTSLGGTSVSGMSYSWTSNPAGFTSGIANPTVSPTVTTTYRLTVTNTTTSCTKTDSVKITVNPVPTVSVGSSKTICSGGSTQIGTAAVTGLTYSWTSNPSGFTSTTANPTVSPTVTTLYTLTVTNSSSCSKSDTVRVTVNPLPALTIASAQTLCFGQSIQLGGTSVSGMSYNWTSNPAGFTSSSSNPTVTPASTITYKLTVTNTTTGCTKSDSVKITVNPLPSGTAGPDRSICIGSSTQIGSAAVTGNTYKWTSSYGYTSSIANPTVSPGSTSFYYLSITGSNGCVVLDTVKITVNPLPNATVAASQPICFGSSVAIGASAVTGNTYSWTSRPSGFTSTLANPTVNPKVTTTYYLTETVTATGCSKSDSVTITVNPLPVANAGSDQSVCAGKQVKIGQTSISGIRYSWTSVPAGFTSSSSSPTVSPTATTSYILTTTDISTGCVNSDTLVVTVNQLPTANTISGLTDVCTGSKQSYKPAGSTAGMTSTFALVTGSASGSSMIQNGDSAVINWGTPGTANLWLITKNASGCKDSSMLTVTVHALPTALFNVTKVCLGKATQFTNRATDAAKTIWSFGDGDTMTAANPQHTYKVAGTYKAIMLVISAAGCYDTTSLMVKVDALPQVSFSAADACEGSDAIFSNTSASATTGFLWKFGDGATSTSKTPVHTYAKAGTYTVVLIGNNAAGCNDSVGHTITINPLPVVGIVTKRIMARNFSFAAKDTTQSSYSWNFGDSQTGTGKSTSHDFANEGTYKVTLTVTSKKGCISSKDTSLLVMTGINNPEIDGFSLDIFPNPFNEETILSYNVEQRSDVRIELMDITGKQVAELVHDVNASGRYTYKLDASSHNLKAGIYMVNVQVNGANTTRRIVKVN